MLKNKAQKGFTLIEILVVIAIIAILAAIVLVAINPGKRFLDARQSQRHANVESILSAIQQNMVDHKGILTGCPSLPDEEADADFISDADIDLAPTACVGAYLAILPVDPTTGEWNGPGDYDTKYKIWQDDTTKQVTIFAQSEVDEDGDDDVDTNDLVSVTR